MKPEQLATLERARQYLQFMWPRDAEGNLFEPYSHISDLLSLCEELRGETLEEAAKVCEQWGDAKVEKWSGTELEDHAKSGAWDALQCAHAIRSLKGDPICLRGKEA